MRTAILAALVLPACLGAEWKTSRELHCTKQCLPGTRRGRENVYWCPAVDGVLRKHEPDQGSNPMVGATTPEEDRILWDYCTPAPEMLHAEPDQSVELDEDQGSSGGGGYNPGGAGHGGPPSSLVGVRCKTPCVPQARTKNHTCKLPLDDPWTFPCSPEIALRRYQVSSIMRLWCLDECSGRPGVEHHMCKTMMGYDRCSLEDGQDSRGEECVTPCQLTAVGQEDEETKHYQCKVENQGLEGRAGNSDCGFWAVEEERKSKLEFTTDSQVCAGPCVEEEGLQVCSFVNWNWNEGRGMSILALGLGTCRTGDDGWGWVQWTILAGGIVAGLAVIAIVAVVVSKKGYSRAATSGA